MHCKHGVLYKRRKAGKVVFDRLSESSKEPNRNC